MSLHIYAIKDLNQLIIRDIAISFLKFFNGIIHVNEVKFRLGSEIIYQEEIKSIESYDLNKKIEEKVKENDIKLLNIEFSLSIKGVLGFLSINNSFDSKIFGSILVDIFQGKIDNKDINIFVDLLLKNIIKSEQLDKFFSKYSGQLVKAYVDIKEEGEDNPLDVLYEYGYKGSIFFMKLLRAVEILSEEDNEILNIYEKIRSVDKNYFSSRLWNDNKIRNYAFQIANENNIVAQEGSFRLYANDKDKLKIAYEKMVKKILSPIFIKIPSIENQINKFSSSLPN